MLYKRWRQIARERRTAWALRETATGREWTFDQLAALPGGAAVAETYLPEPGPALAHGCHRTNDLVELSDGLVFLRDRAGDQINVAGRKIFPETIERLRLAHPQVLECLGFGMPSADAERTDSIVAGVAATLSGPVSFPTPPRPILQTPRQIINERPPAFRFHARVA